MKLKKNRTRTYCVPVSGKAESTYGYTPAMSVFKGYRKRNNSEQKLYNGRLQAILEGFTKKDLLEMGLFVTEDGLVLNKEEMEGSDFPVIGSLKDHMIEVDQ